MLPEETADLKHLEFQPSDVDRDGCPKAIADEIIVRNTLISLTPMGRSVRSRPSILLLDDIARTVPW